MKSLFPLNFNGAPLVVALASLAVLASCGGQKEAKSKDAPKATRAIPITTATAQSKKLEIREDSVGSVEARSAPTVSTEVAGKVKKLYADVGDVVKAGARLAELDDADLKLRYTAIKSDYNRLKTLVANQERNLTRLRILAKKKVTTENQIEDAEAQLKAMKEQLEGAGAMLSSAERDLGKSVIKSPISGKVENRMVFAGEFLTPGRPVFVISNGEKCQVHLPYPESLANRIMVGQLARLSTPSDPGSVFNGVVEEVRPSVNPSSKAIDVIVNIDNPGGWKSGASVSGSILVEIHGNAVTVPALSVVLRPAGEVVYVIGGNKAIQRLVKTGKRLSDAVEITEGLKSGEVVARDGASYLSDGAEVKIQEAK